jgi:hypothetical protein
LRSATGGGPSDALARYYDSIADVNDGVKYRADIAISTIAISTIAYAL